MLKGITVGCGYFGNVHLEGWSRVEGARILAVVDRDGEKAKASARRFGLEAYVDLAQAIEELSPDFVDVATRPDSHLEIVHVASAKGCHVLCQKPIAPTWEESVQLVETCERQSARLMINENWRWQPWYREIKTLIEAGAIGRVTTITLTRHAADALHTPPFSNQRYFVDMKRFLLIESVIHLIDVVRFLGGEIDGVYSAMRRVSGATRGEDNVHLHLRLKDDVWGIIYSTRCSEPDMDDPICDSARLEGECGFIRLDSDGRLWVKPLSRPVLEHKYEIPAQGYRGDSVRMALQHFVDCMASDKPFETQAQTYLNQVMGSVFAGYESAHTGRTVQLPYGQENSKQ
ncbi:MAG: Gfo/Idh/MocA family oxidoreductase [Anaerolineae bacterium]|jgi:predicted dehydrogenase